MYKHNFWEVALLVLMFIGFLMSLVEKKMSEWNLSESIQNDLKEAETPWKGA